MTSYSANMPLWQGFRERKSGNDSIFSAVSNAQASQETAKNVSPAGQRAG